jgi:hypothetical protein
MKGHRNRQPLKSDYTHALGQVAFCFSICEWNVVLSCERISPGALQKIVGEEFTAGQIAKLKRCKISTTTVQYSA